MITRFTPYEIEECLFDTQRTRKFQRAIKHVVRKNDVVIDAGSGCGILGLFAARCGAKKVYCIEANPRFISVIKENALRNGYANNITVIRGDAAKARIPEKADVLIAELLSTGLFYEPVVRVMRHLVRYVKKGGSFLPVNTQSSIALIHAQTRYANTEFSFDARYRTLPRDTCMSDTVLYDTVQFAAALADAVCTTCTVRIQKSGTINAVRINSTAALTKKIILTTSTFLFNPLTIFLKKPIVVKQGEHYEIKITYPYGSDTFDARFVITKADT